jgi:hypothetical protein
VKEIGCGLDRGSSRNLLGGAEKNHEKLQSLWLLPRLRTEPVTLRIGSADINHPAATLVIP